MLYGSGPECQIEIPISPPKEYDIIMTVSVQHTSKYSVSILLSESGNQFAWTMQQFLSGGCRSGFQVVDGADVKQSSEVVLGRPNLQSTRKYTCKLEVRKGSVKVYVDGKFLIHTVTANHTMTLRGDWVPMRNSTSLGLLGHYWSTCRFDKLELRQVTGKARDLR